MKRVAIIGGGKLGRALARALRAAGVSVSSLRGRGSPSEAKSLSRCTLIWLAVPDPFIEVVAERIAPSLTRAHAVVHASGSWGKALLASCARAGASIAVCHPLISFGARTSLRGASFVFDGDAKARRQVRTCVTALQGRLVAAHVHGPRYHAAAALLANGATALAAEAERWLIEAGFPRDAAPQALGALLQSVAQNISDVGPRIALTGPISRGDARAVTRHLEALSLPEREVYANVASLILKLACEGGLSEEAAAHVRAALLAAR